MLKQKHPASSSNATETSSPLSNSEKKSCLGWHANISASRTPGDLLKRYAAEKNGRGAVMLAHALNMTISKSQINRQINCTYLYAITELAIYTGDVHERRWAIDTIKQLLQYGAKIKTEGPCPIKLLMNANGYKDEERIKRQLPAILAPFLDYPETFEIKGDYEGNIAHMFAQHACGSLRIILKKKPELVNTKQKNGRTLLGVCIEKKQTENALMVIREFNADISLLVNSPLRALSMAIYFNNLPVLKELLARGAPIEMKSNAILPNNEELIYELSKSGYFLTSNHPITDERSCFFTLESEDGKTYENIYSDVQIKETLIIPSQAQIKRLYLSFTEIVHAIKIDEANALKALGLKNFDGFNLDTLSKNAQEGERKWSSPEVLDYIYTLHVDMLFDAFKKRFPLNEEIHFKQPEDTKPQETDHGPDRLQACIYTASLNSSNQILMENLENFVKAVISSPRTTEIKIDELIPVITRFHEAIIFLLMRYIDDSKENQAFRNFAFKVQYRFATKIIPIFLKLANKQQLDQMFDAILMIASLACNHFHENTKDSSQRMVETLELIAQKYHQNNSSSMSRTFLMLSHIVKFKFYSGTLLYDALIETLESMINLNTIVLKESTTDSFQKMIWLSFGDLLDRMQLSLNDVKDQIAVIDRIEVMLNELIKKGVTRKEWLNETLDLCNKRKVEALTVYQTLVNELKQKQTGIYQLGDFDGKVIKITFPDKDEYEIDTKQLRAKIKKIDNITHINGVFHFTLFGLNQEEINQTIVELNSISLEEIKLQPADESKPISPASNSAEEYSPYVMTLGESSSEKQPIKKQKNKMPVAPAQPIAGPSTRCVTQEMINEVKIGIKNALNLREDADLFPIDHPGFPETRKHLCFGLWSDISARRPEFITEVALESHHDLAITGKVVTFAYGQNGLKPTKVIDASTGKFVDGLKTKRASDDLRINSAPVKVRLQTKEEVLLYVFGVATDHKQDAPKIDTAAIMMKSRK